MASTIQEKRHTDLASISSKIALNYNQDALSAYQTVYNNANITASEIEFLQGLLSSTKQNINELRAELATAQSVRSYNEVDSFGEYYPDFLIETEDGRIITDHLGSPIEIEHYLTTNTNLTLQDHSGNYLER
jgi:hypothetical protein